MVMRCEKFWLRVSFFLTLSLDFEDSFLLRDISNAAKLKIKFRARGWEECWILRTCSRTQEVGRLVQLTRLEEESGQEFRLGIESCLSRGLFRAVALQETKQWLMVGDSMRTLVAYNWLKRDRSLYYLKAYIVTIPNSKINGLKNKGINDLLYFFFLVERGCLISQIFFGTHVWDRLLLP